MRTSALIATMILIVCAACTERVGRQAGRPDRDAIQKGTLMDASIRFQYAIYYLPLPTSDPLVALKDLLTREENSPELVDELPEAPAKPVITAQSLTEVQTEYAPPDIESLQYFGRGLSRQQAEELQKCRHVFILDFAHQRAHVWEGLRSANRVLEAIARETDGLLWDEQTREVFTPDEWHKRRIDGWMQGVPDISKHTTIHAYKADEYIRAITLGMSKFGLPDVVVEEFSWSLNRTMGHLINLLCQSIAEGAVVERAGEFDLDIREIRHSDVRDPQIDSLKPNGTGVARLTLSKGQWEEGDPPNRLIEIGFDRYPGRDVHAQQEELLSSLFGWEDSLNYVKHDEELLAASKRAKARLPKLRDLFARGLEPGEYIQVKAPFETPDGGQEWMWVEITSWKGNRIKGLLKNEPFDIPSLHSGQIVKVNQQDVFDYIRYFPDGTQEGNETGAIIEKMQQATD